MSAHLVQLLFARAEQRPESVALRHQVGGRWVEQTYAEMAAQVRHVAHGLITEGVEPGDAAVIMASNRPEWLVAFYAVLAVGAVAVPLDPHGATEEIGTIFRETEARVAFVSGDAALRHLRILSGRLPSVRLVVSFDQLGQPRRVGGVDGYDELPLTRWLQVPFDLATAAEARRRSEHWSPDDVALLLYAQDSTGYMRGVVQSHRNVQHPIDALIDSFDPGPPVRSLTMLPLSQPIELSTCLLTLTLHGQVTILDGVDRAAAMLEQVRPDILVTSSLVMQQVLTALGLAGSGRAGTPTGLLGRARTLAVDRRQQARLRDRLGGPKRLCLVLGSELAPEVVDFLTTIGVRPFVVWGRPETGFVVTANTPWASSPGSVGRPIARTEVVLDESSQVLVRGPGVMRGYYGRTRETQQALRDGWLHTGQTGRLDDQGFLHLTSRMNDVIVTVRLAYVSPRPLEASVEAGALVAEAVVIGDDRPHLTVLIRPDLAALREALPELAEVPDDALVDDDRVVRLVGDHVRALGVDMPDDRRIRAFRLVAGTLGGPSTTMAGLGMTRRQRAEQDHADLIEEMYAGLEVRRPGP